jgi:hypothetical protein
MAGQMPGAGVGAPAQQGSVKAARAILARAKFALQDFALADFALPDSAPVSLVLANFARAKLAWRGFALGAAVPG